MADNDELTARLERVEKRQEEEEKEIKPLLDLYNAGVLLGRMVFFGGGIIIGIVTIWKSIGDWLIGHMK